MKFASNKIGLKTPEDYTRRYPTYGPETWCPHSLALVDCLVSLVKETE